MKFEIKVDDVSSYVMREHFLKSSALFFSLFINVIQSPSPFYEIVLNEVLANAVLETRRGGQTQQCILILEDSSSDVRPRKECFPVIYSVLN